MKPASKPASVRTTLLTLLLPSGIVLMAIAWIVHGLLLDRMSRGFVESRLHDEVAFLELQVRQSEGQLEQLQTGDYFEKVFHHAFALNSPTETTISPDFWAPVLSPLFSTDQQGAIRVRDSSIPGAPSDILAYRRELDVGAVPIVIIVAEDMDVLRASQAELHVWTAIVSTLLILLLVAVIWVGIALALRPVASLQAALKSLQEGSISRISVRTPEEFRPLVKQLNQLLDSLDQRLERSRNALGNLSHSVKTPIAAVRQILEDNGRAIDPALRAEMANRLIDIDKQLEAEMRRSRFAGPQVGKSAEPVKQARDLLWMLGRLYPEKSFELTTELADDHRWPVEQHDLNEILGNLLDNAGKWAQECVELQLAEQDNDAVIAVVDDGPGVPEQQLSSLGTRGVRLDEQTPGHGLGLAIVREITHRYGGHLKLGSGPTGGLTAHIHFPKSDAGNTD
ncbi:ATP-binding protein [Marinobacter sp.]|uniref:ATP-binding protein n=1 Tax=Marinobacter sp. TaxID=50741 RepID=UPI0019EFE407|nr:ATP-binding protein [Marinobacter sp.]MBE0485393.1 GHKL domain-containing protein [Marinobacter sp.]